MTYHKSISLRAKKKKIANKIYTRGWLPSLNPASRIHLLNEKILVLYAPFPSLSWNAKTENLRTDRGIERRYRSTILYSSNEQIINRGKTLVEIIRERAISIKSHSKMSYSLAVLRDSIPRLKFPDGMSRKSLKITSGV